MGTDPIGRKVVTAAELEAMSPEQRRAHFEASIVWDLSTLPPEYLARVRADAKDLIAGRDAVPATPSRSQRSMPNAS